MSSMGHRIYGPPSLAIFAYHEKTACTQATTNRQLNSAVRTQVRT